MQEKASELIRKWKARNIEGILCKNRDDVHRILLDIIPEEATVGFSGSKTLDELEIIEMLETRGNKVFNQYDPSLSREESMRMRRLGAQADFFLTSANAIAETGELVFLSAFGHRIAGIADAPHTIVICGLNKIVPTLEKAIERARNYVTPLNCKRLKWDTPCFHTGACDNYKCIAPQYKRMCCQLLVVEAEVTEGRLTVLMVAEDLGF
ncbi:MAG: lactate utilization protein [Candidatus Omnitrophica bacterium]|nr:lactate utilization protein [Candidatus Omnitrophota bacterium]